MSTFFLQSLLCIPLVIVATLNQANAQNEYPLPQEIVSKWQQAGATAGWLKQEAGLSYVHFRAGTGAGQPGETPGFRFLRLAPGKLVNLPKPKHSFGLMISDFELKEQALQGLSAFDQLQLVELLFAKITDEGIKEFSRLHQLRYLNLAGAKVTDQGLQQLVGLAQLQHLDLGAGDVTDEGMKVLAQLTKLKFLGLDSTKVSDVGIQQLTSLADLETLELSTSVQGTCFKDLARLKKLRQLRLVGARLSKAGISELVNLSQLQVLNLNSSSLKDADLQVLSQHQGLRVLQLQNNKLLSSKGLLHLARMTSLQELELGMTRANDEVVQAVAQLG